ncbi:BatA domain-containing protein [Ascidiimonas sp. W6]|uniref:BatA domain-containing protein n=1 Tax=Ascidiimonas meishanensis TaxID=3128903 RepID=UPI0030ECEA75
MQFKNPDILWALFLFIIPVIVHLFQLRKFQKVSFTNVKFLKEVATQTRKSRNLKKWLTLLTRILLLCMLVIAFAQPYTANRDIINTNTETIIYLDNSFSMQASGKNGPLFENAVQELIASIDEDAQFSIFTNTETFKKTTLKATKKELLELKYAPNQLSYREVLLKARNIFSKDSSSIKNLIFISDFQSNSKSVNQLKDSLLNVYPVVLRPVEITNISIDSIYVQNNRASGMEVNVVLKRNVVSTEEQAVSLYNKDVLIAKAGTDFKDKKISQITFTLPSNKEIEAFVSVEDTGLFYDDTFFFNINSKEKVNVLSINDTDFEYLERIYTPNEFNLTNTSLNNLNFSDIENQNLIVLNELSTITPPLLNTLSAFKRNGGFIIFIPSLKASIEENNLFLSKFGLPKFSNIYETTKKITNIAFDHPLFQDVFEQRVNNFQYPQSLKGFSFKNKSTGALSYQDGTPFLWNTQGMYIFTSPLASAYSNFKNSPLIVPVFYNIALKSLPLPKLYYTIGTEKNIAVKASLSKDEVLTLVKDENRFIPLQQSFSTKVLLTLNEEPNTPGIYDLKYKNEALQKLSFNHLRTESSKEYDFIDASEFQNMNNDVSELFNSLKKENSVTDLWKWFVIFALGFLIMEILILKFLK